MKRLWHGCGRCFLKPTSAGYLPRNAASLPNPPTSGHWCTGFPPVRLPRSVSQSTKTMTTYSEIEKEFDEKFECGNDNPALIGKGDAKAFLHSAILRYEGAVSLKKLGTPRLPTTHPEYQ